LDKVISRRTLAYTESHNNRINRAIKKKLADFFRGDSGATTYICKVTFKGPKFLAQPALLDMHGLAI